jgi:hypothetical protein
MCNLIISLRIQSVGLCVYWSLCLLQYAISNHLLIGFELSHPDIPSNYYLECVTLPLVYVITLKCYLPNLGHSNPQHIIKLCS